MYNLKKLITDLSSEQLSELRTRLQRNKAKLKLLEALLQSNGKTGEALEESLIRKLGYEKNKGAFYTLCHRFVKDISQLKIQFKKNELSVTVSRISNLRLLLYSKDHALFEYEVKDLKKKVQELEIKRGVYEIYFCEYLFHYTEPKLREVAIQNVFKELEDEKIFLLAEMEFYRIILEFQDLFFSCRLPVAVNPDAELHSLRAAFEKLPLKTMEFFLLSAELTFDLRFNTECLVGAGYTAWKIERLLYLFDNFQMNYRFPNCRFAIACLFNKHALASGNMAVFQQQLKDLEQEVEKIIGFKTYENVLFYYWWARSYDLICNNRFEELRALVLNLNRYLEEGIFSGKFQFYLMYLLAVSEIYLKNYRKALSWLLQARNAKKYLGKASLWIQIENSVLALVLHLKTGDARLADYEAQYLRRLLRKHGALHNDFREFLHFVKNHINNPLRVFIDLHQALMALKQKTGLLALILDKKAFW